MQLHLSPNLQGFGENSEEVARVLHSRIVSNQDPKSRFLFWPFSFFFFPRSLPPPLSLESLGRPSAASSSGAFEDSVGRMEVSMRYLKGKKVRLSRLV